MYHKCISSYIILIFILLTLTTSTLRSQTPATGKWQCTGSGLDVSEVSFLLDLKQSGNTLTGTWVFGEDVVPIHQGSIQGNQIELITLADEKRFTSVATIEGDQLKGTWKDDTGRSGTWQGKRSAASRGD
ncbi:MAG: hypothetical protein L0387_41910 [Acidobacteria bacterium]|nr:hypothetical protein [Acidobacteriota bacterium]